MAKDPKPVDPDKMSRRQQFVATYRMAKKTDTRIGLWLLGAFVLAGVHEVEVDFNSGQASVLFDRDRVAVQRLMEAVNQAGYRIEGVVAASLLVSALAFAADAAVAGVQWLVTPKTLRGRHAEDATLVTDAGEAHLSV